jgi:hypothetical protein
VKKKGNHSGIQKENPKNLMDARIKRAKNKLKLVSHTFIRKRDSIKKDKIGGYCFDCGNYAEGGNFQAGHFYTDAGHGATLRYHPNNMHGQSGGCNMKVRQEVVKINYTLKMQERYGMERFEEIRQLKNKSIKADIIWYETMIELYEQGDEQKIIDFLEQK